MQVLLILKSSNGDVKVIVRLRDRRAKDQVLSLLEHNRVREAFELLKDEAEVKLFLPTGAKLPDFPDLTLVEELIGE